MMKNLFFHHSPHTCVLVLRPLRKGHSSIQYEPLHGLVGFHHIFGSGIFIWKWKNVKACHGNTLQFFDISTTIDWFNGCGTRWYESAFASVLVGLWCLKLKDGRINCTAGKEINVNSSSSLYHSSIILDLTSHVYRTHLSGIPLPDLPSPSLRQIVVTVLRLYYVILLILCHIMLWWIIGSPLIGIGIGDSAIWPRGPYYIATLRVVR